MKNQNLNKHIVEVFDNVMSENTTHQPIGATSLNELRKKATTNRKKTQPKKIIGRKIKPKSIKKKITLNKPKKYLNNIKKVNKITKPIRQEPSKFDKLKNISKQSLIGASVFSLLSLPPIINLFYKILPNNTTNGTYKEIIMRTLLFTIIYVLISKYFICY